MDRIPRTRPARAPGDYRIRCSQPPCGRVHIGRTDWSRGSDSASSARSYSDRSKLANQELLADRICFYARPNFAGYLQRHAAFARGDVPLSTCKGGERCTLAEPRPKGAVVLKALISRRPPLAHPAL